MSDVSQWSPTDANNSAAPPDGFPEGMAASAVNDSSRAVMGSVRRLAEDGTWFDFGHTATFVNATTFQVPGDLSAIYAVGRRVRTVQTGTLYGIIASVVVSGNTDVTVTFDSGSLAAGALTVSLGPEPEAIGLPNLGTAATRDVGTSIGNLPELVDVGGSPGLPAVDGSQLTGIGGETVLLAQRTAALSSSLTFVDASWFNFRTLLIDIQNMVPAIDDANLHIRASRTGGSTWLTTDEYRDCNIGVAGDGTSFTDSTLQNRHGVAGEISNSAGFRGASGRVWVTNIQTRPFLISHFVWRRVGAFGPITGNVVYCMLENGGAINGLQVLQNTGAIASGTAYLYGING